TIWPGSACVRCWPARSPTSHPPASRRCCYRPAECRVPSAECQRGARRWALGTRSKTLMDDFDRIDAAAEYVRKRIGPPADVAVVLGSGLGAFGESLTAAVTIPYEEIPGWPASRVVGHAGKLVSGLARKRRVLALSGRVHFYEGHRLDVVTFATRVI